MAKLVKRPAESWRYVLRGDRALPIEQQTVFTLAPLTMAERAQVHDDITRTQTQPDGTRITLGRTRQTGVELVLSHVVAIENFPVGAPEPWPTSAAARARYLERLQDDDVLELGNEIFERSDLGDEDVAKNSSRPEPTSGSGADSQIPDSTTADAARESPR